MFTVKTRAHKNGDLSKNKFEIGQNFLPLLKVVTRTANVAKDACDQCSIFSTVQ